MTRHMSASIQGGESMEKANALQLRQNMGRIIARLQKDGQPILLEKDRKPVAVLITIEDYQKRFVDFDADIRRKELVQEIRNSKLKTIDNQRTSLQILRELRYGS